MAPGQNKFAPSRRWVATIVGVAAAALITCHAAVLGYKKFADVDEGYAAAIAERLLEGFKLYDGAVSQRGPLMYYGFAAMMKITGWDSVIGIRCWALAFCLAHVLLVYWAGRRLISPTAGVVAALATVYGLGFGFPARDAMALHGEALQLPALIGAAVVGAEAMRRAPGSRARLSRIIASGLLLGIAVSIKQSVLPHMVPLAVWILVEARKRRRGLPRALGDIAALTGATLFVPAILVANALRQGTLRQLVYYCVTYNLTIHLHPTNRFAALAGQFIDRLNERTLFFLALAFLLARALPFVVRRVRAAIRARSGSALVRAFGVRSYLALHLVLALAVGSSMSRFFPHYFLPAMPFMTVLLGAAVDPLFKQRRTAHAARVVTAVAAGFLLLYSGSSAYFLEKIDGRIAHGPIVERLAKYIEASTTPDQRVFVWGFSPWLYSYSHRRPAGRYVFETYVTGFVPWFWEDADIEKQRIVPGSVEALLGDLDREKPEIVVDAGAVLFGRTMRAYTKPLEWLKENYCFELRFEAFDLYRRKRSPDAVCEAAHFPRVHGPVDFYGGPAPYVMMPLSLDYGTSAWLPSGAPDQAIMFPGQTRPPFVDALRDLRHEKDEAEALKKLGVKSVKELLPPSPCENPPPPAKAP